MISRTHRFHGHRSLAYLYKRGKTVRSASLALRYCPNERRTSYRTAVVVSRKVHKSAVVRNRIRRRLYENVRLLTPRFAASYDLALLVYDEKVAELPPDKLAKEVAGLFKKAGILSTVTRRHAIVEPKE